MQPNNPDAGIWLALLLHQTGREADAKVEYEQILRLQSDNPVALNNLAYVIAEQGGDLDLALTYAQRAKQKLPQSLEVADTLGWIYLEEELTSERHRDLQRSGRQGCLPIPPTATTWGWRCSKRGDKPQARKELEAALRNKPSTEEAGKIKELLSKFG